jgi:hypothetical protein
MYAPRFRRERNAIERTHSREALADFIQVQGSRHAKTNDLRSADYTDYADYGFITNTAEALDTRSTAHGFRF